MAVAKSQPLLCRHHPQNSGEPLTLAGMFYTGRPATQRACGPGDEHGSPRKPTGRTLTHNHVTRARGLGRVRKRGSGVKTMTRVTPPVTRVAAKSYTALSTHQAVLGTLQGLSQSHKMRAIITPIFQIKS